MSTRTKSLVVIVMLSLIATAARSDGIGRQGILGQAIFGGIGGALKSSGGGGSCSGVIDASKGCPLPMLGM